MAPPPRSWASKGLRSLPWGIALLYGLTLPVSLPDFDAGEFAALARGGGVAHPPGYPLYTILLRTLALLGAQEVWQLSALSAACGALAATVLLRVGSSVGLPPVATGAAVGVVFTSAPVWRASTALEPFALNLLLAAVALWMVAHRLCRPTSRPALTAFTLGAMFGLGLCNHHTLALLVPLALVALWRPSTRGRDSAWAGLGFVAGALPLLYFFWSHEGALWVWGSWSDPLERLPHHLLRREYGTFALASERAAPRWIGVSVMLAAIARGLSWLFLALLGLALAWRGTRSPPRARGDRALLLGGLGLTALWAGPVFALLFRMGETETEVAVIERFAALPLVLLALPLAWALAELLGGLLRRGGRWPEAALVVLLVAHVLVQLPSANRRGEVFNEDHIDNQLTVASASADDPAVIFALSDTALFGLLFGKSTDPRAQSVTVVPLGLLRLPWVRERLDEELGPDGPSRFSSQQAWMRHVIETRRAFTTSPHDPALRPFVGRSFPIGPLVRLLPPDEEVPPASALFARNVDTLEELALPTERSPLPSAWERDAIRSYARTFDSLSAALRAEGAPGPAAAAERLADHFRILAGDVDAAAHDAHGDEDAEEEGT